MNGRALSQALPLLTAKAPSANITNKGSPLLSFSIYWCKHERKFDVLHDRDSFISAGPGSGLGEVVEGPRGDKAGYGMLADKVDVRLSLEQDDITNLMQEEITCVYFNIAKVEQGEGNKL